MICGWVFLKIFVQVWNIYIKKRKSESRLAPALLSPHATVGDLAKTHCSTAGLSAADAEHGNVQSNCRRYFLTNVIFQPLRINMRGCLPDQLWTFHISSVPINLSICARGQVTYFYSALIIFISFGKVLSISILLHLLYSLYHYQIILYM